MGKHNSALKGEIITTPLSRIRRNSSSRYRRLYLQIARWQTDPATARCYQNSVPCSLNSDFNQVYILFEIMLARLPYQETAKVWRSNLNITYTSTRVKYGFNDVQPLSLQIQTSTNHWTTWRHHFCPLREMAGSCICLVIKTPKSQPFRRPRLLLRHVFPTSRLLCPNGDGCHYARLLNNEHGRKHRF